MLSGKSYVGFNIRSILMRDLESLRSWKNINMQCFFHNREIGEKDQEDWYKLYLTRDEDFMFIVGPPSVRIGCIGVRHLRELSEWDIYNVILGDLNFKGSGIMSVALIETIDFAVSLRTLPVTLRVLKTNPAIGWYKKNMFVVDCEEDSSIKMRYTG